MTRLSDLRSEIRLDVTIDGAWCRLSLDADGDPVDARFDLDALKDRISNTQLPTPALRDVVLKNHHKFMSKWNNLAGRRELNWRLRVAMTPDVAAATATVPFEALPFGETPFGASHSVVRSLERDGGDSVADRQLLGSPRVLYAVDESTRAGDLTAVMTLRDTKRWRGDFRQLEHLLAEKQPTIFHYLGHWVSDEEIKVDGQDVAIEEVASALAGSSVDVVVLTACNSGAAPDGLGLASPFLDLSNFVAVIANSRKFDTQAATLWAKGFYESLVSDTDVEQAMIVARKRVGDSGVVTGAELQKWVPVLYSSADSLHFADAGKRPDPLAAQNGGEQQGAAVVPPPDFDGRVQGRGVDSETSSKRTLRRVRSLAVPAVLAVLVLLFAIVAARRWSSNEPSADRVPSSNTPMTLVGGAPAQATPGPEVTRPPRGTVASAAPPAPSPLQAGQAAVRPESPVGLAISDGQLDDPQATRDRYRSSLEQQPGDLESLLLLAEADVELVQTSRARAPGDPAIVELLQEASDSADKVYTISTAQGLLLQARVLLNKTPVDLGAAQQKVDSALRLPLDPASVGRAHRLLAQMALQPPKHTDIAVSEADKAFDADSGSTLNQLYRAQVRTTSDDQSEVDQGCQLVEGLVKTHGRDHRVLQVAAGCADRSNDSARAIELLKQSVESNPNRPDDAGLASLLDHLVRSQGVGADLNYIANEFQRGFLGSSVEARLRIAIGDLGKPTPQALDDAQTQLDEAVRLDDKNPYVHHYRGDVLRRRARPEAEAEYRKALDLQPRLDMAAFGLGATLLDRNNDEGLKTALPLLERGSNALPDWPEASFYLGDALTRMAEKAPAQDREGLLTKAENEYRRAIAVAPTWSPPRTHLGAMQLDNRSDITGARQTLDDAVQVGDGDATAPATYARALLSGPQPDADGALKQLTKAGELAPGWYWPHLMASESLLTLKRWWAALGESDEALKAVPTSDELARLDVLSWRRWPLQQLGRYTEAVDVLKTYVGARPDDLDARYSLGSDLLATKLSSDALVQFDWIKEHIAKDDPRLQRDHSLFWLDASRGDAFWLNADYERAAQAYLDQVDRDPNGSYGLVRRAIALRNIPNPRSYSESIHLLDQAIEIDPYQTALVLKDLSLVDDAKRVFAIAASRPGAASGVHVTRIEFLMGSRDDVAAEQAAADAIYRDPPNAALYWAYKARALYNKIPMPQSQPQNVQLLLDSDESYRHAIEGPVAPNWVWLWRGYFVLDDLWLSTKESHYQADAISSVALGEVAAPQDSVFGAYLTNMVAARPESTGRSQRIGQLRENAKDKTFVSQMRLAYALLIVPPNGRPSDAEIEESLAVVQEASGIDPSSCRAPELRGTALVIKGDWAGALGAFRAAWERAAWGCDMNDAKATGNLHLNGDTLTYLAMQAASTRPDLVPDIAKLIVDIHQTDRTMAATELADLAAALRDQAKQPQASMQVLDIARKLQEGA